MLKVRPRAGRKPAAAHGLVQLGVECYGGGLWHTWLDRDLGVAGRVVVRGADGAFDFRLVRVDRPVVRVPSLCIHLQNADERKALEINKETHLMPVLCAAAAEQLGAKSGAQPATNSSSARPPPRTRTAARSRRRCSRCSPTSSASRPTIVDLDLTLFDTQRGAVAGAFGEFVTSSRLDDQASVAVLTEALVHHATTPGALDADADVTVFAAFDHEEIGSESSHGDSRARPSSATSSSASTAACARARRRPTRRSPTPSTSPRRCGARSSSRSTWRTRSTPTTRRSTSPRTRRP